MAMAQVKPYGQWISPITPDHVSSGVISLDEVEVHESSRTIYLLQGRPAENGRGVITASDVDTIQWYDRLPQQHSARSKIHEYAGAAFTIDSEGRVIYVDWDCNGVFSLSPSIRVEPGPAETECTSIIEGHPLIHYADFNVHPKLRQYVLAVQETHSDTSPDVHNNIVIIDCATKSATVLVSGADFYAHPKWNEAGTWICWTQWTHPDMPWTGSQLYAARCTWSSLSSEDHCTPPTLSTPILIAGAPGQESVCQPRWAEGDSLFFVSDCSGWWQLYLTDLNQGLESTDYDGEGCKIRRLRLKGLEEAEFGCREITLGSSTYVLMSPSKLVAVVTQNATSAVVLYNLETDEWIDLQLGIVQVERKGLKRLSTTEFVIVGATMDVPTAAYVVTITDWPVKVCKRLIQSSAKSVMLNQADISIPRNITFPQLDYRMSTAISHAVFFSPRNSAYTAPQGTHPPVIVWLHGGPSSHISPAFSLTTQYWTSRGYAYVYVNYTGSTSYGRAYRERLNGHWGVLEPSDARGCVQYLSNEGMIDPRRVGIAGESAGGYSVLQALCTYPEIWAGGISQYGIGDLKKLAEMMHKFEKYYIQQLLFGYEPRNGAEFPACKVQNQDEIYRERSPCYHANKIKAPLLLMQGTLDKVVPLSQATDMVDVIRNTPGGGEVDLMVFEGEGHGWVRQESLRRAIEQETMWWGKTLLQ